MVKKIARINLSLIDQDADGVPDQAIVSYELHSIEDKSYKQQGKLNFDFNPFETIIAAMRLALQHVADREGITLE